MLRHSNINQNNKILIINRSQNRYKISTKLKLPNYNKAQLKYPVLNIITKIQYKNQKLN
ncbi:unnamed protein product [Paramecium primaurelia]|uniref:Uncharacterized protein n=1 Tax=Paramecium primaurelia TaxID=5886 RepID=A0A8S1NNR8_PARPR|nr:unnamed protein product [Paramecium primaurelia]